MVSVQNSHYSTRHSSHEVLTAAMTRLSTSLQSIHATTLMPSIKLPAIPPELIEYVDHGRNPDIYTREFVELARKSNQLMKGKMDAFGLMRDALATAMRAGMPELEAEVDAIVVATGGKVPAKEV